MVVIDRSRLNIIVIIMGLGFLTTTALPHHFTGRIMSVKKKNLVPTQIQLPRNNNYDEILRAMVQLTAPDEPYLEFLVSMWSYSYKNEGLTPKQEKALQPYMESFFSKYRGKND